MSATNTASKAAGRVFKMEPSNQDIARVDIFTTKSWITYAATDAFAVGLGRRLRLNLGEANSRHHAESAQCFSANHRFETVTQNKEWEKKQAQALYFIHIS